MDKLKREHDALSQNLTHIVFVWQNYRQVYLAGADVIDIMNRTAHVFFGLTQSLFLDAIILGVARLVDPHKMGRFSNLSLETLLFTALKYDPGFVAHEDLQTHLSKIQEMCAGLKEWRNKVLAHNDYNMHMSVQDAATLLSPPTIEQIDRTLGSQGQFLNRIYGHFFDSEVHYGRVLVPIGDGESLVYQLRRLACLAEE